jgi:hypothetical protein
VGAAAALRPLADWTANGRAPGETVGGGVDPDAVAATVGAAAACKTASDGGMETVVARGAAVSASPWSAGLVRTSGGVDADDNAWAVKGVLAAPGTACAPKGSALASEVGAWAALATAVVARTVIGPETPPLASARAKVVDDDDAWTCAAAACATEGVESPKG